MNPSPHRVRFGLLAVLALVATLFVAESGKGQSGNRGGFTGNSGGNRGFFGGGGSPPRFGPSGHRGEIMLPPKTEFVWICIRCRTEVGRGHSRPTTPCPVCSRTSLNNRSPNSPTPSEPGGWNRPSSPNVPPQQNQPNYPPMTTQPQGPLETGIQPSPGGFFDFEPQPIDPADESSWGFRSVPSRQEPSTNGAPTAKPNSNRGPVLAVMFVLLVILGVAAGVLVMLNHSRKKYAYRSSSRRRRYRD